MRRIFLILFMLSSTSLFSQSEKEVYYMDVSREVGLNSTALLQNFIRIGDIPEQDILRGIFYKRIKRNRNGFRMAFGARSESQVEGISPFFFLSMGYERRLKTLYKFSPYWAFDMFAHVSDRSNPPNSAIKRGFGFGPVFGFNYNITDRLSIGTESAVYFTISDFDTELNFIPPTDLVFYIKFPKKVLRKKKIRYF